MLVQAIMGSNEGNNQNLGIYSGYLISHWLHCTSAGKFCHFGGLGKRGTSHGHPGSVIIPVLSIHWHSKKNIQ